ncbi:hypothetical protein ACYSNR_02380 [Enterococcus sp. LJL128]|uniref:hypothetical protein n=1 Tax=Enterococcus sp. LJL51 TaxID=3416656 RepID=UPI003CF73EBC
MKQQIQALFRDKKHFAAMTAEIDIQVVGFEEYSFSKSVMQVDILMVPKKEIGTVKDAFSALFKKELFDSEEWPLEEEPNKKDAEWLNALENVWIPAYFGMLNQIDIQAVSPTRFFSYLHNDLAAVETPLKIVELLLEKMDKPELIQVQKGYTYRRIFGQSSTHYFFFDYGIYD